MTLQIHDPKILEFQKRKNDKQRSFDELDNRNDEIRQKIDALQSEFNANELELKNIADLIQQDDNQIKVRQQQLQQEIQRRVDNVINTVQNKFNTAPNHKIRIQFNQEFFQVIYAGEENPVVLAEFHQSGSDFKIKNVKMISNTQSYLFFASRIEFVYNTLITNFK